MAKKYDLQLRGFVGGYAFDGDYISWFLDRHKNTPVTLLIESRGGLLATGISVCSAIRDHADVSVHFVGMNASAATIASLGARHISMACDAWYLVHKASVEIFEWASLNADQIEQRCKELEKQRAELAKFDVAISEMYSRRCKKDPKDMLALMSKETWLTAKEALEWGFIDEITDLPDDIRNEITDQVLADFSLWGISLPEQLRSERHEEKDSTILRKIRNLINSFRMDPQTQQPPQSQPQARQQQAQQTAQQQPDGQQHQDRQTPQSQPRQQPSQPITQEQYDKLMARLDAIEGKQQQSQQQPQAQQPTQVVNIGGSKAGKGESFADRVKSAADLFKAVH